jgi:CcmD family protein
MSLVHRIARTFTLMLLLLGSVGPLAGAQTPQSQPPTTTAAQDEYVPIDQLPDSEKLPAAPYLIAAYIVVWGVLLVYVLTLWRRLGRVETDLREARRVTGGR